MNIDSSKIQAVQSQVEELNGDIETLKSYFEGKDMIDSDGVQPENVATKIESIISEFLDKIPTDVEDIKNQIEEFNGITIP